MISFIVTCIYIAIGGSLALIFFQNLLNDFRIIKDHLPLKTRKSYKLALFYGPAVMFVAWPLVYIVILIIHFASPETIDLEVQRKKLLDRHPSF